MIFERGELVTNEKLESILADIAKNLNNLAPSDFNGVTAGQFIIKTKDGVVSELMTQKSNQYFANSDIIMYNKATNRVVGTDGSYFDQFYVTMEEING